jgi:hypothetical protein
VSKNNASLLFLDASKMRWVGFFRSAELLMRSDEVSFLLGEDGSLLDHFSLRLKGNLGMTVLAVEHSKSAGPEKRSGDEIRAGSSLPYGAHQEGEGANFALFSRHATRVLLEFYEKPDACSPTPVVDLDPARHRTGDVWHVWLRGISAGPLYAYRIDGPYQEQGHRLNVHKLLLDPFTTALAGVKNWDSGTTHSDDGIGGGNVELIPRF